MDRVCNTLYSPSCREQALEERHYNEAMKVLVVDLMRRDIPNNMIDPRSKSVSTVFDFLIFVNKMFRCRGYKTDVYLVLKESLIPVRARSPDLSDGYLMFLLVPNDPFDRHFPTIARCSLAINCGFISECDAATKDIDELEEILGKINIEQNVGSVKRKRQDPVVGSVLSTYEFDAMLEQYHLYDSSLDPPCQFTRVVGRDGDEDWMHRAECLTPRFLFEHSKRMSHTYRAVIRLYRYVCRNSNVSNRIDGEEATYAALIPIRNGLRGDGVVQDLINRYIDQFIWEKVFSTDGPTCTMDLRGRTAWVVGGADLVDLKYFHRNCLYVLPVSSGTENQDLAADDDVEHIRVCQEEVVRAGALKNWQIGQKVPDLYPAMVHVTKLFRLLQEETGNRDVCSMYIDHNTGPYMAGIYNDTMKGFKLPMSRARARQYEVLPILSNRIFQGLQLNSSWDERVGEKRLFFSSRTASVDSFQGMFAYQLVTLAKVTGVCHLTAEFVVLLLSNIGGLTPQQKIISVIDGPSGSGKSYTCKAMRLIVNGSGDTRNEYTCVDEHYSTTRASTMPCEDPYENVLGQKLIEEWQSGEGGKNFFISNTNLEATVMKNVSDHGITKNARGYRLQDSKKYVKCYDFAMDDRAAIYLANGFHVASSLKNRMNVFHVPGLNSNVRARDFSGVEKRLSSMGLPQMFSMVRYLISEGFNREHLNMDLTVSDGDVGLDEMESAITLSRIRAVMDEMGFVTREILTPRKEETIKIMAKIIAHWRAVSEIYGGIHTACSLRQPNQDQPLGEYNDYLVGRMVTHLRNKTDYELATLQSSRVVVDPADILSAMTLMVQLTEPDRQLVQLLCSHMADPSNHEIIEGLEKEYLVLPNMSVSVILEELKRLHFKVLDESVNGLLSTLETKQTASRMPCILRKMETGVFNRHKENRTNQQFKLYINAEYAATIFAQEQKGLIGRCVRHFCQHLTDIATGSKGCKWHTQNRLNVTNLYVKLPVPDNLCKAFNFLYFLPAKPRHVTSPDIDKTDGGYCAAVWLDFGKSRARVLQMLTIERMVQRCSQENGDTFFDDNGYVEIDLTNTELFDKHLSNTVTSFCEGWETRSPMVVLQGGKFFVHLEIFCSKHDKSELIRVWRKRVMGACIRKGVFAKRGYFVLPQSDEQTPEVIMSPTTMDLTANKPLFIRHRNRGTVQVHISLLSEISPLEGVVTPKANQAVTLVEKCLCQDMTDLKTVMVFDREKVYTTQKAEDAITFVSSQDVAFRHPNGSLPSYTCTEESHLPDGSVSSWLNRKVSIDKEGLTFHPFHRKRKLAFKQLLMMDNKWQGICIPGDMQQSQENRDRVNNMVENMKDGVDSLFIPFVSVPKPIPYPECLHKPDKPFCLDEGSAFMAYRNVCQLFEL